ncbi:MAG: hypothetical protein ACI85K_003110, partial [Hyphomicrobiaceae bacterium]
QSRLISYVLEENRVFRELQGKKRPRLNDDQRRRLAAKGKPLGRRLLDRVAAIVTPDTIMRWHRRLIAEHLRRALSEFANHYHSERPHQGIGNERIAPSNSEPPNSRRVVVDERLGGVLCSYRRAA